MVRAGRGGEEDSCLGEADHSMNYGMLGGGHVDWVTCWLLCTIKIYKMIYSQLDIHPIPPLTNIS